mmetsp:Transcript_9661/g.14846  ORF Transcript_9661/g.14846 Transcript_9661/m.14846 type:complete len:274 (-) Transcript_9661:220-1041(-)
MRTSYSFVAVARSQVPSTFAGLLWYCQYAPSASVYHPIYQQVTEVPHRLSIGSLFKYNSESMFWVAAAVGNWVNMWRMYTYPDLQSLQQELETETAQQFATTESVLMTEVGTSTPSSTSVTQAQQKMTEFASLRVDAAWQGYTDFFHHLMTKYHDGFRFNIEDEPVEMIVRKLFYPHDWLTSTGTYQYHKMHDYDMAEQRNFTDDQIGSHLKVPTNLPVGSGFIDGSLQLPFWGYILALFTLILLCLIIGYCIVSVRKCDGPCCQDKRGFSIA